jgi:2-oxoglutarate ferredoxin oxidoreductase subunit gamma
MDARKKYQIIFGGVGGQGLVLCGFLLGEAASIYEKKQAVMTMTYGAESRGTFTKADVIVSDEPIDFVEVEEPDVVICLAQQAYERYYNKVKEGALIIYDQDEVKLESSKAEQKGYRIRHVALENGGVQTANLVSMGILVGLTGLVKKESVLEALESRFAGKDEVIKKNASSFLKGLELAK